MNLTNGTTLTSDRVNEATEALAFGKDRLEAIGQLLCCTDCLHLENSGLEGFRNMLADVETDIENALKAFDYPKPVKNAEEDDEPITEVIQRQAMNKAFFNELMNNPDMPVKDALPRATSAFNKYIADEYKKHGLDEDEAPCFYFSESKHIPITEEEAISMIENDEKNTEAQDAKPATVTDYDAVLGRDC